MPSAVITRAISRSAATGSGTNIRPDWHRATSNAPSGNGSATASPWCHSRSGRTRRATLSMASLRSSPTTRPGWATRSAATRATMPVPHATSSTRLPAVTPPASTRCGANPANSVGTNAASYISATSAEIWKVSVLVMAATLHPVARENIGRLP